MFRENKIITNITTLKAKVPRENIFKTTYFSGNHNRIFGEKTGYITSGISNCRQMISMRKVCFKWHSQ